MSHAPETLEGWYALHDVRRLDRHAWSELAPDRRKSLVQEMQNFLEEAERVADAPEGTSGLFEILGHKGDLLFMHLRPALDDLHGLEARFQDLQVTRYLHPSYSFLSIVEMSRHGEDGDDEEEVAFEDLPEWVQGRLKPEIPDMRHICFYPMNKRRGEQQNWFTLSQEERAQLMVDHGTTGRKYAGRVQQVISGAMGLDDWEWGVTLFAHDPLQFKKLVYEMRFDRVSALYAEFGPFYVGTRRGPQELPQLLRA